MSTPPILSASFFWQNNLPTGLGFTLTQPIFQPKELTEMFAGEDVKKYFRASDDHLGQGIVNEYLAQLAAVGQAKHRNRGNVPLQLVVLCALNIMWLSSRGFIPNDEFNGPQFIYMK